MYQHARVQRVMGEAAGVVRDLFAHYQVHPDDLPIEWNEGLTAWMMRRARVALPISLPA